MVVRKRLGKFARVVIEAFSSRAQSSGVVTRAKALSVSEQKFLTVKKKYK